MWVCVCHLDGHFCEEPTSSLHEGCLETASHFRILIGLFQTSVCQCEALESEGDPKLWGDGSKFQDTPKRSKCHRLDSNTLKPILEKSDSATNELFLTALGFEIMGKHPQLVRHSAMTVEPLSKPITQRTGIQIPEGAKVKHVHWIVKVVAQVPAFHACPW